MIESKQVLGLFIIAAIVLFTFWFANRYHQYLSHKHIGISGKKPIRITTPPRPPITSKKVRLER